MKSSIALILPFLSSAAIPECTYNTPNHVPVTKPLDQLLPSHCFENDQVLSKQLSNPQVYALDVNIKSTSNDGFQELNATWTVPTNPASWYGFGYVNYFWSGFKATQPSIGFPVLQPVLQYGEAGAEWQVQSWFVNQQPGGARSANAPPINDVQPGDTIVTSMTFNQETRYWTVLATNERNKQVSNLTISYEAAGNTTYDYAMFVYENILTPKECNQLPKSGGVTFTDISLDEKKKMNWTYVHGRTDCDLEVKVNETTGDVDMKWDAK